MDVNDEVRQAVAREVSHAVARKVAKGVALFIGFLVFIFAGGFVVQLLWNWLLPSIFGVREVTFWQALGLLALSRILFGGFGRSRSSHAGPRRARREWWRKSDTPGSGSRSTENGQK